MLRGTLKALLLACAVSVLACPPAISQDWPRRPVKIIVIASPGGFPDIAARTVANQLTGALGQPVVVENRAGGGGNIATDAVAKAAPDGHTLLLTGNNHAVNPTLLPNPGFDYEKDLAPITMVAEANMVLVGSPALQANNITELIALSKRTPKAMSIATSAIGTPNHLGAELLIAMTKIDFVVVPYKGIGPAIPDLVSGQVQVSIAALTAMLPLIKSGKLKALAVTRPKRSEFAPEIPTAAESGLPGFDVNAWVCIMVTGGTPQPVIQRLNSEIRKIMANPEIKEAFNKQGTEPWTTTPEELSSYIKAEAAKWADVLKNAKMR